MDTISKPHRSWNMSRIRSRDTKPEQAVRSVLHRLGFRFRNDSGRRIAGRPDVVLPKYRTVIFVHGCFWHRHARCRFAYTPKSRKDFWSKKFGNNQRRDAIVKRRLKREGWRVIVIWECEITRTDELALALEKIRSQQPTKEGRMQNQPALCEMPSTPECAQYVRRLTRWIGPGFHPDTRFRDYTRDDGERCFDARTCAALEVDFARAWDTLNRAGIEIYRVALPVQQRMLRS